MIKISIDMMGAELGVKVIIDGILLFIKKHNDVVFHLVGNKELILSYIKKVKLKSKFYKIHHTSKIVYPHDNIFAIKNKKDSSMIKSIELVKNNLCDGLISGGPTAVFLAACHIFIKEIPGIKRPGFMPFIPTIKKGVALLLDVGANLECDPKDLENFALMASVYAKTIFNINDPKVGLLNIGEEKHKGKKIHKDTFELLTNNQKLNFYGNIEPRYIFNDICDVLVTDGYSGNLILKTFEGTAHTILNIIKRAYKKSIYTKIAALISRSVLKDMKSSFNYKKYNGALFIGLNKIVFKTHGSSDALSYYSVINMTYESIKNNVLQKIKHQIERTTDK